uniref:Uncharacterized protein n=1 Tax=Pipistrellus kuhlii TaxID=59472 RepID=A0A7J8B1U2_PIPKU|nr:hypothetical protein mPipKuh1_007861 [Pipistrellus kuhlii]
MGFTGLGSRVLPFSCEHESGIELSTSSFSYLQNRHSKNMCLSRLLLESNETMSLKYLAQAPEQPGREQPGPEQPGLEQQQPGSEQPGLERQQPDPEQLVVERPGATRARSSPAPAPGLPLRHG